MAETIGLCDFVPTGVCVFWLVCWVSIGRLFFEALPNMVEFANTYEMWLHLMHEFASCRYTMQHNKENHRHCVRHSVQQKSKLFDRNKLIPWQSCSFTMYLCWCVYFFPSSECQKSKLSRKKINSWIAPVQLLIPRKYLLNAELVSMLTLSCCLK